MRMIMRMFRVVIMMGFSGMIAMFVLVIRHKSLAWPFLQEEDYIDELEDAESVKDEQGNEPPYFAELGGIPQGIAFEDDRKDKPQRRNKKKDRAEYSEAERAPYLGTEHRI